MDERTDSYFSLEAWDRTRFAALLEQDLEVTDDLLLREALGIADETTRVVQATVAAPRRSLLDEQPMAVRLLDIAKVTPLLWNTRWRLRHWPIERVLQDLRESAGDGDTRSDLRERARRFLSVRRYAVGSDTCLVDSVALLRWLGNGASQAELVFGVNLNPFRAHCWVQSGEFVLNDRIENVAAFTPVRVIPCSDPTP